MSEFCKRLKNSKGVVIGLWVANPDDPNIKILVEEFNTSEGLPAHLFEEFKEGKYRTAPNYYNNDGGAFLMFGKSLAPGERKGRIAEEFCAFTADQWLGFATRTIPLHWMRIAGFCSAIFSALPLLIGGLPLLNSKPDPDYELAVTTFLIGVGMLAGGLLMVYVDAFRQRREIERGELNATGVFWNPTTNEKLEGVFAFHIDSGGMISDQPQTDAQTPMPILGVIIFSFFSINGLVLITLGISSCFKGDMTGAECIVIGLLFPAFTFGIMMLRKKALKGKPTGFKHRCKAIWHNATQTSDPKSAEVLKPILRMVFSVDHGLVKGEFASRVFNKHADLDTIVFAKDSILRMKGTKAAPNRLCTAIGNHLKDHAPNRIAVQLVANLNPNAATPTQSSNAGVIGAGLFGVVGGVVGSAIQQNKEERQRQEQAAQQAAHQEAVTELFHSLKTVATEFGWTAEISRDAAG